MYTRRPLRHCTLDLTGEYVYHLNYRIIVQLLFLVVTKSLDYALITMASIGKRASASSVLCQDRPEGSSRIFCSYFHFLLSPSMPHDKRMCLHFKKWECVTNNIRKPEHEFSGIISTLGRWLMDIWFKIWFASIAIKKAINQNSELNSKDNTRKMYLVNYYVGRIKRNETEHSVER